MQVRRLRRLVARVGHRVQAPQPQDRDPRRSKSFERLVSQSRPRVIREIIMQQTMTDGRYGRRRPGDPSKAVGMQGQQVLDVAYRVRRLFLRISRVGSQ